MARCQALHPSLHDLRDQFSDMAIPVLLAVGDEDAACLENNLMLKSVLPNAGLWISPNTGRRKSAIFPPIVGLTSKTCRMIVSNRGHATTDTDIR
jgi:hypothetical protein